MPDELCRRCGFELKMYLKCTECRIPSQFFCLNCDKKTHHRFHFYCNAKKENQVQGMMENSFSVA